MLVAYAACYGAMTLITHFRYLFLATCVYLACFLAGFYLFRTYRGIVRYSSFVDLIRLVGAMFVGSMLVLFVRNFLNADIYLAVIGGRCLFIGSLIAVVLMCFVRMAVKTAYDVCFVNKEAKHVMVYGTKRGGVSIAKSISNLHPSPYIVEGFITHSESMVGHTLVGVPVLEASSEELWDFMGNHHVKAVLISPMVQEFFLTSQQDMIDRLVKNGIRIMMMPAEQEWDGKASSPTSP